MGKDSDHDRQKTKTIFMSLLLDINHKMNDIPSVSGLPVPPTPLRVLLPGQHTHNPSLNRDHRDFPKEVADLMGLKHWGTLDWSKAQSEEYFPNAWKKKGKKVKNKKIKTGAMALSHSAILGRQAISKTEDVSAKSVCNWGPIRGQQKHSRIRLLTSSVPAKLFTFTKSGCFCV